MGIFKFILLSGFFLFVVFFLGSFFVTNIFRGENAILKVASKSAQNIIYIDGEKLGNTPLLKENLSAGNHEIKIKGLVNSKEVFFTKNIILESQKITSVNLDFGPGNIYTSWDLRYFEKGSGLKITSKNEGIQVKLDGEEIGKTPLKIKTNIGVHKIKFSSPGFITREIEVNIEEGYMLNIEVFLAANPIQSLTKNNEGKILTYAVTTINSSLLSDFDLWSSGVFYFDREHNTSFDALINPYGNIYYDDKEDWDKKIIAKVPVYLGFLMNDENISKEAAESLTKLQSLAGKTHAKDKKFVIIKATPTGTLNVRSGPSLNNSIITKVSPNEKYELLNTKTGWYKIKVSDKTGWISSDYANRL